MKIKDEETQNTVTLQSFEVKKIPEDEYQAGWVAKPAVKPAPMQPASAQPVPTKPRRLFRRRIPRLCLLSDSGHILLSAWCDPNGWRPRPDLHERNR